MKNQCYVVADDEKHIGAFCFNSRSPGSLHRVAKGKLPLKKSNRKKRKMDLESLVLIREQFLLLIPSGSSVNRHIGKWARLNSCDSTLSLIQDVDFSLIFKTLRNHFHELNIEGAIVHGRELLLFQRGNGVGSENAMIRIQLAGLIKDIEEKQPVSQKQFRGIIPVKLGKLKSVPLSFTDACAIAGGDIVFSAAAEDSKSTYHDGICMGSVVGIMNAAGKILAKHRVSPKLKIEGIHAYKSGSKIEVFMVNDEDDVKKCSGLFHGEIRL